MNKNNFEYDSDSDILYIYNLNESVNVMGSIVCNNIIIDIASSGEIVGMQIENASEFLIKN